MRHKLVRAVRLMAFVTTAIEESASFRLVIGYERKLMTGHLVKKK